MPFTFFGSNIQIMTKNGGETKGGTKWETKYQKITF